MEVWNQEVMLNAKTGGQSKEKGQVRMSETKVWGPAEVGRSQRYTWGPVNLAEDGSLYLDSQEFFKPPGNDMF